MTHDPKRLEHRALALSGALYTAMQGWDELTRETALAEIGGLETLATLLNKAGALTETGLSFTAALIEETRGWLDAMSGQGAA